MLCIRLARISMKMRNIILIFLISLTKLSFAQIESNTYQLNTLENLLTDDVKKIISYNIENKSVVFLGESAHHMGSDFLAKTEFVKYLVNEKATKTSFLKAIFLDCTLTIKNITFFLIGHDLNNVKIYSDF